MVETLPSFIQERRVDRGREPDERDSMREKHHGLKFAAGKVRS